MKRREGRWLIAVLVLLAVPLLTTACGGKAADEAVEKPAVTEKVKGTDLVRVVLTAEAVKRIGVQTVKVRSDGGRAAIPYEAVLYDPNGDTWTYTNPEPRVFQRANITVARVVGNSAILATGPHVGTAIVTVGAPEIWGVEYGGIEED